MRPIETRPLEPARPPEHRKLGVRSARGWGRPRPSPGLGGTAAACLALLALLAGAGPLSAAAAAADAPASAEHWYALTVDGAPAGWAREGWRTTDAGIESDSTLRMRVRRGDSELTIEIEGRFVETADGRPVRLWTRRLLGRSPVEATYEFGPDGVEATTRQGDRERRESLPRPAGDWLTPAAARRAVAAHHRAGDRDYTVRSIDPSDGLEPKSVTRTWLGAPSAAARAAGATGRWREDDSDAPGVASTVALDDDGELVRSTVPFLGLELTLQLTDRESALAAAGTGPELLGGDLRAPRPADRGLALGAPRTLSAHPAGRRRARPPHRRRPARRAAGGGGGGARRLTGG